MYLVVRLTVNEGPLGRQRTPRLRSCYAALCMIHTALSRELWEFLFTLNARLWTFDARIRSVLLKVMRYGYLAVPSVLQAARGHDAGGLVSDPPLPHLDISAAVHGPNVTRRLRPPASSSTE